MNCLNAFFRSRQSKILESRSWFSPEAMGIRQNVLLDDDMVAHVTNFGLARLLSMTNGDPHNQSSTTMLKGTIGYAPPEKLKEEVKAKNIILLFSLFKCDIGMLFSEYEMSCEVSMQGNVYSFGILVLEMVTGRRPMEEMFKDDNNLAMVQIASFPETILCNGHGQG
ncbi:hypothetical protein HN51_040475 [Arachis hypogaea]